MKYQVVSVGDSVVDYFYILEEAHLHANIDYLNKELCLNFADKIPVNSVQHVPLAGNAANFAVGAARLGLKTAIYTNIADDYLGEGMIDFMKKEGIGQDYIKLHKDTDTIVNAVISFHGERTILTHHGQWHYKLPDIAAEWIYFTSVGAGHEKLDEDLIRLVRQEGIKLGFNPGSGQIRQGLNKLRSVIELCEVFIVNKEEAQELLELRSGEIQKMLMELKMEGPRYVVITDGQHGSFAYDGSFFYHLEKFPGPNIEATGAGDSYSTGFICAMIYGKPIEEAMVWGTVNAGNVVQKIGPQAGLVKLSEMNAYIKKHPGFRPDKTHARKLKRSRA